MASDSGSCPSQEILAAVADGTLHDEEMDLVCEHLKECEACETVVSEIEEKGVDFLRSMLKEANPSNLATKLGDLAGQAPYAEDDVTCALRAIDQTSHSTGGKWIGQNFAGYQILSPIGAGGMGTVYLARHLKLQRDVALKVINSDLFLRPDIVKRFEREMKAAGKVQHRNIVLALDAGEERGVHYLAMEYVEGETLSHFLASGKRVPIPVACEIAKQLAEGLQHAHDAGLIHRDVKPSNCILTSGDDGNAIAKILDLGLARIGTDYQDRSMTHFGGVVGTVKYMSPEQANGETTIDARTDVYSLGVLLYRLVTGRMPYDLPRGSGVLELLQALAQREPIPVENLRSDIPKSLAALINRAIAKDREVRTADCQDLANSLGRFAKPFKYPPDTEKTPKRKAAGAPTGFPPRNVSVKRLVLATAVCLAIAITGWVYRGSAIGSSGEIPPSTSSPVALSGLTKANEGGDGYRLDNYHPIAPDDGVIEVSLRGRQSDLDTLHLYYEAKPGNYVLRVVDDVRGLLNSDRVDILFYLNGDRSTFDPATGEMTDGHHTLVDMPGDPAAEFEVKPGTQKFSVVPAIDVGDGWDRIPRTHTVCTFYCYPDLTYADAKISAKRLHAGNDISLSFALHNCGMVEANPGVIHVRLEPVGSQSRSIVARVPYPSIQPGAKLDQKIEFRLSRFLPEGDYSVTLVIDATDCTVERDELGLRSWKDPGATAFVPPSDVDNLVPFNNVCSFEVSIESSIEQ